MGVLGIGVDIVEIERFASSMQRSGQAFLDRLFLPDEQAYCSPQREPARCFAARFAAKEAVSKALGTGIGAQLGWRDIEVRRKASGARHSSCCTAPVRKLQSVSEFPGFC